MPKSAHCVEIRDPRSGDAREHCLWLEEGKVLSFPETPFEFSSDDRDFLVRLRSKDGRFHKNIAYRPAQDRVTGANGLSPDDAERLNRVLAEYSRKVVAFLSIFLQPYSALWRLDYASFRPFQEKGRDLRLRARNDLLHIDNFPTRPTQGGGILRFFTNINPEDPRRWVVTGPFENLVERFGGRDNLPWPSPLTGWKKRRHSLIQAAGKVGLPLVARPPYDDFMLKLHHAMKEDEDFQEDPGREHLQFAPGSCWMVFTDRVAHAALEGQYALEQTFMVSRESLVDPERSPLRVLERLSGHAPLVG